MKSQITKWLNEPKLSSYHVSYDVTGGLLIFNFNSVGFDVFPGTKLCFACILILSLAVNIINKFRLDNIAIKAKELKHLKKEKKFFDKISRQASISKGKKKVKKGKLRQGCSKVLSTELK